MKFEFCLQISINPSNFILHSTLFVQSSTSFTVIMLLLFIIIMVVILHHRLRMMCYQRTVAQKQTMTKLNFIHWQIPKSSLQHVAAGGNINWTCSVVGAIGNHEQCSNCGLPHTVNGGLCTWCFNLPYCKLCKRHLPSYAFDKPHVCMACSKKRAKRRWKTTYAVDNIVAQVDIPTNDSDISFGLFMQRNRDDINRVVQQHIDTNGYVGYFLKFYNFSGNDIHPFEVLQDVGNCSTSLRIRYIPGPKIIENSYCTPSLLPFRVCLHHCHTLLRDHS